MKTKTKKKIGNKGTKKAARGRAKKIAFSGLQYPHVTTTSQDFLSVALGRLTTRLADDLYTIINKEIDTVVREAMERARDKVLSARLMHKLHNLSKDTLHNLSKDKQIKVPDDDLREASAALFGGLGDLGD